MYRYTLLSITLAFSLGVTYPAFSNIQEQETLITTSSNGITCFIDKTNNNICLTDSEKGTSKIIETEIANAATAVIIAPDGTKIYVANSNSNTIEVFDLWNHSTMSISNNIGIAPSALALSPDSKKLYVANSGSNSISIIDLETHTAKLVNKHIPPAPSKLLITSDGKKVFVLSQQNNIISSLDTSLQSAILIPLKSMGTPDNLVISPDNTTIVLTTVPDTIHDKRAEVFLVNIASNKVTEVESKLDSSSTITFTPDSKKVFLGSDGGQKIQIIDITSHKSEVMAVETSGNYYIMNNLSDRTEVYFFGDAPHVSAFSDKAFFQEK